MHCQWELFHPQKNMRECDQEIGHQQQKQRVERDGRAIRMGIFTEPISADSDVSHFSQSAMGRAAHRAF